MQKKLYYNITVILCNKRLKNKLDIIPKVTLFWKVAEMVILQRLYGKAKSWKTISFWAKLQSAKNIGKSTPEPHFQLFYAKSGSPCCKNDKIFNGSFW